MRRTELALDKITDTSVRESLGVLADEVAGSPLSGFRGKHFAITKAAGTYSYPHKLSFRPQDVLQTSLRVPSGTATITWHYDSFTKTHLSFTVTTSIADMEATVRAFIGSHRED